VLDPAKREIEAAYDCPAKGAHQMALLPDESKVYVSCKEGDLSVFDGRGGPGRRRCPCGRRA
jgi:hypothetical protein